MKIKYMNAYLRITRTQYLRNGLGISFGYYNSIPPGKYITPGPVTAESIDLIGMSDDPWTFSTMLDTVIDWIEDGFGTGFPITDVVLEHHSIFTEWIDAARRP